MRHTPENLTMEFSLPIPQHLTTDSVLSKQWAKFSQRFYDQVTANTAQDSTWKPTSMLLFAALPDMGSICDSLTMYDVDMPKLSKILEVVERVCLPRFILLFERFRYFTLEQGPTEALPDFVQVLRKQVDLCEFGKMKDGIMIDTLVNGMIDQSFKQSLKSSEGLCFDDAVTLCSGDGKSVQHTAVTVNSAQANKKKKGPVKHTAVTVNSAQANKKKKGPAKKTSQRRQRSTVKNMYIMPVCDSMNDEVDDDDHIVETVVKASKKPVSAKQKKKAASAPSERGQKVFQCFSCDNKYATRKSFRRHIAAKHGDCKEYLCKHCDKKFSSRTECITHCKGHLVSSVKKLKEVCSTEYRCWYCNQEFTNLPDYKKHSLTHTAVRVFTCELCQKKNHTISRMIGHLKGHLNPKHKCEICANCFGKPELLATHMLTHAAQPVHQCQVCSKSFVSADRLHGHMRTHSGEKRFTCELCGKSFSQKMSFDYHKRWHAGEKPYECEICGRRTRSFGDLRKHKRMHSDKRPYVCETCGKSFRFISNLNRHKKGHSGKRSFVCDVCGRTFIYGEGLRDHIKAGRCPGRKNEGENKGSTRAPRARAPHILPHSHPHPATHPLPHPHQPPAQAEGECHPVNYATSHPHPETLISEFPPAWQYMLSRNNEGEASSGLVVVPPYYQHC